MQRFDRTISTPDGAQLAGRVWVPLGEPVAVVQVAHGMAEHAARYEGLAVALTDAGYAVVAVDHRGHGRTRSEARAHMADEDGWEKVVADVRRVGDFARDEFPGRPLFLFGHSWGSLLARDHASRWGDDLAGLVIMSTPADPGVVATAGLALARLVAWRGRRRPSRLLDRLSFGSYNKRFAPNRTRFDWLSRDEAAVDAYVSDPDCGFVCSAQFFVDLLVGLRRVYLPAKVGGMPAGLPVLLLAGGDDPAAQGAAGTARMGELLRAAGVRDVTTRVHEGARHELLHETCADEVTAEIVAWLESKLPPESPRSGSVAARHPAPRCASEKEKR